MAYTKHNWQAREGTGLSKYTDTITGQVLNLQSTPDSVTQEGTPFTAEWMNEMEQGIENGNNAQTIGVPQSTATAIGDTSATPTVDSALLELSTYNKVDPETAEVIWPDASERPEDPTVDEALGELGGNVNQKATTATYTASVTTSWTANSGGGYYKTVSVSGILATDNPVADIVLGSDIDANALYLEAWALVTRITTASNSITLYANGDAPETAFTCQLKVVR